MQSVDFARAAGELDLEWRLKNIPASAKVRGVFFSVLNDEMQRRRLASVPEIRRFLTVPHHSYALYPATELVEAFAIAGALIHPDPREGMRELFSGSIRYVTQTWYGKFFSKYLRPYDALRWIERSREYIANYGRYRLEPRGDNDAILHKYDEYFWLDALRGGCEGMLEACGVRGEVKIELDSPFCGRFVIHWTDPS